MAAAAITIMTVTFLAGFAGNVKYIYPVSVIFSVTGVALFLLNRGRGRKEEGFWERVFSFVSPSMAVIGFVFVYCGFCFRKALFTYPDEVYQWGSAVKYMASTGRLPYGQEFTGDAVTFSICSIFQYFFSGIGEFIESNTYVGNFILTFVPVMLPCRKSGWKRWKSVFAYASAVFFSLNIISYIKYYTILQDYVLPMWAGGVLAWILWRGEEKINRVFLFCSLAVIAAMKSLVGPLFVCMIILTAFLSEYFRDCDDHVTDFRKLRMVAHKKYLWFLPLLITPFFVNIIWSGVISSNVLSRGIGTVNKSASQILSSILDKSFTVIESSGKMPHMSYVIFFGLYAMGIFLVASVLKKHKNEIRTVLFLYLVGAFLYMGVMFYVYMNVFGASDSETVAGLERYAAYYMLVGVGTMFFPIFYQLPEIDRSLKIKAVSAAISVACLYGTSGNFIPKVSSLRRSQESDWKKRVETKEQVEKFRELVKDDGRVFLIGKLETNNIKMLTYELGRQYSWDLDSYTMGMRNKGKQILINVAKYPELLTETEYKYVWFSNPNEKKKEYDYLRHYFKFESAEDGDIYEIQETDGEYCFKYLGNVPTWEE
ncbi:hypothetical protein AALA00_03095 [Lachnospiraceae bacterium 46-15]